MPTCRILPPYPHGLRYTPYWEENFTRFLGALGYDASIVGGAELPLGTVAEPAYAATQTAALLHELFRTPGRGDAIVFANAWHPGPVQLNYLRLFDARYKFRLFGFWRDGLYDTDAELRNGLLRKPKHWARHYELALYESYDANLFFSDEQAERFHRRYRLRDTSKSHVVGYPFVDLGDEVYPTLGAGKEDVIVFPYPMDEVSQEDLVRGLASELPEYEFVFPAKQRMSVREYRAQLLRAKLVFSSRLSETDPTLLVEAMQYGCVPVVPDRLVYREVFPEKYRYPSEYTKASKYVYVLRSRDFLADHIRNRMMTYSSIVGDLVQDAGHLRDRYYSGQKFKTILGV
jgi:hypothetical protein